MAAWLKVSCACLGLILSVRADESLFGECETLDADCALVALQNSARKLQTAQDPSVKIRLKKLPRLKSRREPRDVATSGMTGAAWSDFAVEVKIGTQSFPVVVDTGSSTFAVPDRPLSSCSEYYTGGCQGRHLQARYGSANWSGYVCQGPEVRVAGLSAGYPMFAGIYEQSNFLTECSSIPGGFVSSGIIGMAYPALLPRGLQRSLWDDVVATSGVRNIFAMQCCPWDGLSAGSGSLTLGGYDQQTYSEEDLAYTPITMERWFCVHVQTIFLDGFETSLGAGPGPELPEASCSEPLGSCILADCEESVCDTESLTCRCEAGKCNHLGKCRESPSLLASGNRTVNESRPFSPSVHPDRKQEWNIGDWFKNIFSRRRSLSSRCSGIVDSGTSSIVMPKDVHEQVLDALNQVASARRLRSSCLSELELEYFPDMIVRLDSVSDETIELRIPAKQYFQLDPGATCRSLYLRSSHTLNSGLGEIPGFILGQPLLETYYTVFDKEKKRIGFAPLKGC